MKRIIDTLNNMSFDLPDNFYVTKDKYELMNGQGFINKENYLSKEGKVISFFEIHRDPDEFLEHYQNLAENYKTLTNKFSLEKMFYLQFNDFSFPTYVIKGFHNKLMYTMQVFINCGDCLGCFMITLDNFNPDIKEMMRTEPLFKSLVQILRTVE